MSGDALSFQRTFSQSARRGSLGIKHHGRGLPPVASWQHRPLLLRVSSDVPMLCEGGVNLPLNYTKPTVFESNLFVGEVLFRIRGTPNSAQDPWAESMPYHGKKRAMVVVVQGKFKKRLCFNEIKSGFECQRPISVNLLAKTAVAACKVVQSGIESDITAQKPYMRNHLITSADVVTITPQDGVPPNIMGGEPPEQGPWADKKARRNLMKNEDYRRNTYFEVGNTYTFGFHSDKLFFLEFRAKLPWPAGYISFDGYLNGQPFPFFARKDDGQYLWKFELWHEVLLSKAPPDTMETVRLGGLMLPQGRRKSRVSLPFPMEGSLLGKGKGSSFNVLLRGLMPPDEDSDSDDEEVKPCKQRLQAARAEQRLLKLQMNAMLHAVYAPPVALTPAQAEMRESVLRAVEKAEQEMRASHSIPFDPDETTRYIEK
eukprot:gene15791-24124_t